MQMGSRRRQTAAERDEFTSRHEMRPRLYCTLEVERANVKREISDYRAEYVHFTLHSSVRTDCGTVF